MTMRIPIGIEDFRLLRERNLTYVDKSRLICELIDKPGAQAVLLPRPRRFGKSLNLSMLRCFFEKRSEDLTHLFQDLAVWRAGDAYREHFQRYPVIHMTFEGVSLERHEDAWDAIREKIRDLFRARREVLESGTLDGAAAARFAQILDGSAPAALYHRALFDLCEALHRHHGERVIVLIDEYDQPILAGHTHGYLRQMLDFLGVFLAQGLAGNPHLEKAVLTGMLRIAPGSIFSGLHDLGVYTLLRSEFATSFGFTEAESAELLDQAGRRDQLRVVQHWYNGYRFGRYVIYNPWSVLSYLADADADLRPHWPAPSASDLVERLLDRHAGRLQPAFEALLAGNGVERTLDENVVLDELDENEDALWSLLVFSGYLKAEKRSRPGEPPTYHLTIPNREVREVYTGTFRSWMKARMHGRGASLARLTRALLDGDAGAVEEQLQRFIDSARLFHDAGTLDPEDLYAGFFLGLLAVMEPEYLVRSHRAPGRFDVTIRPAHPGKPGVLVALAAPRPERTTLEQALADGQAELHGQGHAAELAAAGATPVHALVVAFDGKEVRVRAPDTAPLT